MPLVTTEEMFKKAMEGNYAIGAFNINNMEFIQAICDAAAITKTQEALDIIEIDIREAYDRLGEIIGETVSDEVIDEVFSRFCLGK